MLQHELDGQLHILSVKVTLYSVEDLNQGLTLSSSVLQPILIPVRGENYSIADYRTPLFFSRTR